MTHTFATTTRRLVAALLAVSLLAGACGSDDSESQGSDDATSSEGTETTADAGTGDSADDGAEASDSDATDDGNGEGDGDGEDAADSTESTLAGGDAGVDLSDAPAVTVIDAGADPRVELRLGVEPGQTATMITAQTQSIRQELDGQAVPAAGPIPLVLTTAIETSSSGGSLLTYTSEIVAAEVGEGIDPLLASQMEQSLGAMVGIVTTSIIDDRGRVLQTELSGLDAIDPTVAAPMEEMTSSPQFAQPLPEEAVGVGATWEVVQTLPVSGLMVEQTARYELVSIEGNVIELQVTSTQAVPAGSVMSAGGVDAAVVTWDTTATGLVTYDLTAIAPTSSTTIASVQEFEVGTGPTASTLSQTIESTVEIMPG